MEQAMSEQLRPWQTDDGERRWLSMLIDTMEEISRPELRATPCDRSVLSAVSAKLSRPPLPYRRWRLANASHYRWRH
jgi:hypothetical protein